MIADDWRHQRSSAFIRGYRPSEFCVVGPRKVSTEYDHRDR
jgi:hypothetical protein